MDPHKGLFLPYGAGAVLLKDSTRLLESFHYQANYMQDALPDPSAISPADQGPLILTSIAVASQVYRCCMLSVIIRQSAANTNPVDQ